VNALVNNIERIWRSTTETRAAQIVFCDMGVRPTPWGYSVYDEITEKLLERDIPREQIAAMGDAASDAKKQALFEKVRNGSVRILIGSTQKMGTGTNVQKRLVALHHLDAPWKPAEVEQREGRILRQGNENQQVAIFRYVTQGSFDAFMWQALETKARFISQVMTGGTAVRRADDIGGQELSYAEVKAIASGNPAVLTLAETDAELQRLAVLQKNHADEQFLARRKLRELPDTIRRLADYKNELETDEMTMSAHPKGHISIGDRVYDRGDVLPIFEHCLQLLPASVSTVKRFPLGMFLGLSFGITLHPNSKPDAYLAGETTHSTSFSSQDPGPRALLNALDRLSGSHVSRRELVEQDLAIAEEQLRDYQTQLGEPFRYHAYLVELRELRDHLKDALSKSAPASDTLSRPSVSELVDRIKQLRPAQAVEVAARSSHEKRVNSGEEPVTTRVRRRLSALPGIRAP
jgi:hypothetical protein